MPARASGSAGSRSTGAGGRSSRRRSPRGEKGAAGPAPSPSDLAGVGLLRPRVLTRAAGLVVAVAPRGAVVGRGGPVGPVGGGARRGALLERAAARVLGGCCTTAEGE